MIVEKVLRAEDNTGKISIRLSDNSIIESVLLVDQSNRVTACLSCQVGCAQNCQFCLTATIGLKRNLTADEITNQFDLLEETFNRKITNIVYMGMGEPMHNIKNVVESIRSFTNTKTYNIFLRHITISTSGAINGFSYLLKEKPIPGLAFSLITADQTLRSNLMPNTPPLSVIKSELMHYQKEANKRVIIEVICFKGINETDKEAKEIAQFINGLDVIVNLIPFNDINNSKFKEPNISIVKEFSKMLYELGIKVTIRHSKGQDISGACGQLGSLQ